MRDPSRRRMLLITGGTVAGGALAAVTPLTAQQSAHADTFVPTPLASSDPEPNIERAKRWWLPQRNVWTPIGWKGHLFRFNCVYNGALICDPSWVIAAKPNTEPYRGKNFQTTVVMPLRGGGFRDFPATAREVWDDDLGYGRQGWVEDSDAPVLWTEHRRHEGLVIRQTVFAHVPGGGPVQTAVEPIYAWTRFEVVYVDPLNAPKDFTFQLWLSGSYMKPSGPYQDENGVPLTVFPETAPIAGGLTMQRVYNPTGKPITVPITDAAGNARLLVTTADKGTIAMTENPKVKGVYDLRLGLPVATGAHIDVLIPMLPQPLADAKAEMAKGREAALAECQAFWKESATTVATIDTPENYVNQVVRRGPQLAQVVAEKSPDTGMFTFLSGSYAYDVLWSTPTSMVSHMFLDRLGHHDVVEKHIEIYKVTQGTRTPPGAVFAGGSYPGYLSTPKTLQAIDWMSDHGAILEILSVHALLTNRQAFIDKWLDVIVKACDFVVQACGLTGHNGVKGLMPPGHSTDEGVETQGFISQCFTYKGFASAVELLRRLKHPRAAEFAAFADTFRATFAQAVRDLADRSQKWTDAQGKQWPVFRPQFAGEGVWDAFTMLDTGALMSVWAGLMPASDPLMKSFVEFFRVGPNQRLFDPAHHNALYRAVLDHEQSSSEPCYSWNMFHSWRLGDRAHFIEGLYGLLTGGLSQDTYISSEHRNAIYGNLFSHPIITWSLVHAVIDDSLVADQLRLLRLCPLEWLSSEKETRFEKVPTKFGPVTLRMKLDQRRDTLKVDFQGDWHHEPKRVAVDTPPLPDLKWITVNGRKHRAGREVVL
ncbi:hypothetical protein Ssi03_31490 [Sphaerisporangium siamense]|uniref:Tat pathway signal sequence domain protein n=1 Tax=Sphaerisporangium siamense TaxID=795645 RepID=A0A7W7DC82_9ACTN|nr:hypothetical protein [Sphaerisporangium siamense]MBB4704160.1 hypothetical protein [Sphaerisporangium siamense]GII85159.1 hypothetical protein Ssi03_31490 [Sphaerisporangium siamense]